MSFSSRQEELSKIDPDFEKAWASRTRSHDVLGDIHDMRKMIDAGRSDYIASWSTFSGDRENFLVPVRDGHSIKGRVWRPPNALGQKPLVVWFHGGGFCLGDIDADEPLCRRLCLDLQCVVVSLDYRLAPEHPFPTGINDCWDGLNWIAANTSFLRANPSAGFLLGGGSAGANISAVLSHLARDTKLSPQLTGVCLGIPVVVHSDAVPAQYLQHYKSYEQNKDAPILSRESMISLTTQLKPIPSDHLYSPLLWPSGHHDLPPTYFQVCGLDPVRDDGLIYEEVLRGEYGIKTKIDVYPGVPHAFNAAFPDLELSKKFVDDCILGMKWLLEQGNEA